MNVTNEKQSDELKAKFLATNDELATEDMWGVLKEINEMRSTLINDLDILDALSVIVSNL